ncbi:hypothetical protein AN958_03236 [Leucoagaricus sp. SymC.cos]|nr:hypothetical protein AN958_03236 [Leucoagaricus sp. SymC.cos]
MKAYHIAKARDPSDLPVWLFDERERRAGDATARPDELTDRGVQDPPPQHSISSTSRHGERWASASASPPSIPLQSRLRGTDRLKAMREAKREIGEHDSSANHSTPPY